MRSLKDRLKSSRVAPVVKRLAVMGRRLGFRSTATYWEGRYAAGGNSGDGSAGRLAAYKAQYLNEFVRSNDIASVVEFGCGDGRQLALASYPSYIGLDVSPTAVRRCIERFKIDPTKSFLLYDSESFADRHGLIAADVALSLDVLYHLIEERTLHLYLEHLFNAARRYVVIYAVDADRPRTSAHVLERSFTPIVRDRFPAWKQIHHEPNPFASESDQAQTSRAEFFVYSRTR